MQCLGGCVTHCRYFYLGTHRKKMLPGSIRQRLLEPAQSKCCLHAHLLVCVQEQLDERLHQRRRGSLNKPGSFREERDLLGVRFSSIVP